MIYFRSLILFLFGSTTLLTAQVLWEKGKILDAIPVNTSKEETFALYLPSSLDESSLSPIVFIFDPAARGSKGIQPFMEAAEKYGLILICSNASRNSSLDTNFKIANRLFDTVFNTFQIKENEMFLAGFSGGSRLATAIACLTNRFFGLIACGAGFSSVPAHIPSTQDFLYAGLVGTTDMNYSEMLRNNKLLNKLNFKNTLITFDDGHNWPSAEQITAAFDWLYLRHPDKVNDPIFIKDISDQYKHAYNLALKFEKEEQLLFAAEKYERLITSYNPFYNVDSITERYRLLVNSKAFKQVNKGLTKALVREKEYRIKFQTQLRLDIQQPNNPNLDWWSTQMTKLHNLSDRGDITTRNMVARLKFGIIAAAYEWSGTTPDKWTEGYKNMFEGIREIVYPEQL
ncbi:MAG: hypothetical protein AAF634_02370 [Bacteroidota bacterium]